MPLVDTHTMQLQLDEIARTVRRSAHAVLLLDRAGWHTVPAITVPKNRLTEHVGRSRETVRRHLAENALKPWRRHMWCVPRIDGAYVACIENVLDLYAEAPDPKQPAICCGGSP